MIVMDYTTGTDTYSRNVCVCNQTAGGRCNAVWHDKPEFKVYYNSDNIKPEIQAPRNRHERRAQKATAARKKLPGNKKYNKR